MSLQDTYTKH